MTEAIQIEADEFAARILRRSATALGAGAALRLESQADLFEDLRRDLAVRFEYLAEALSMGCVRIFEDRIAWQKIVYIARGVPQDLLLEQLRAQNDELEESLPPAVAAAARRIVDDVLERYEAMPTEAASHLADEAPHRDLARNFLLAVLEGRSRDAIASVREALADGLDVADAHRHLVFPIQAELGRMWQEGEADVADEHLGTNLIEQVLHLLELELPAPPADARRVLIAGVGGDLHDVGLKLLAQTFAVHGWDPLFLGANTPSLDMTRVAKDREVDLLAVAASDALNLPFLAETIRYFRQELPDVPVLVGGRVFMLADDLWKKVGADAGAVDTDEAIRIADRLTAKP